MPIQPDIALQVRTPQSEPLSQQQGQVLSLRNLAQQGQLQQQQGQLNAQSLQQGDLQLQAQQKAQRLQQTIQGVWTKNAGDIDKTLAELKTTPDVPPDAIMAMETKLNELAKAHAERGLADVNLGIAHAEVLQDRIEKFSQQDVSQQASLWPAFVQQQVKEGLATPEQAQQFGPWQGPDTARKIATGLLSYKQTLDRAADIAKINDLNSQAAERTAHAADLDRQNQPPRLPAYQAQLDAILPASDPQWAELRASTLARVTQASSVKEADRAIEDAVTEKRQADANRRAMSVPDVVLTPQQRKVAADVATGDLTFTQFNRLYPSRGQAGAATKQAIYLAARDLNPQFNPSAFEIGYGFASNPKVKQQMASLKNVETGVPDLLKFSDEASRLGATILNNAVIRGGIAIGSKRYSNFNTARIAFADELSGALGYGSATDMSREMGFNMTDPKLSPENFKAAIEDVVLPFVARKKASLLGQMGPYGNEPPATAPPATTPAATSALEELNKRRAARGPQ